MACHSSRSWDPPTLVHVPNPVNAQLNCTLREAMPSPACLSMCHFSETTLKNGQPLRAQSSADMQGGGCVPSSSNTPEDTLPLCPACSAAQGDTAAGNRWRKWWLDLAIPRPQCQGNLWGSLVLSTTSHSPSASAVLSVRRGSALEWRDFLHYPHGTPE